MEFHYQASPLQVVNNGHTIQANFTPGSSMVIDGEEYHLLQFHFHTPSENLVNHKAYAMEGHLVHQSASGELAVLESGMVEFVLNIARPFDRIVSRSGWLGGGFSGTRGFIQDACNHF